MALFFVVVLAALGVAGLVNIIAKRPALNGGRMGGVVVVLLILLRIGLRLSDPDLGRRVGSVFGQAFLPLAVAVWMDRRHAARVRQRGESPDASKPAS